MDYKTLLLSIEGGVATLTLNRPESLNAFSTGMQEELAAVIPMLAGDREVRAVVLTGAGRAFCAGGDMKEMDGADRSNALRSRNELHRMLNSVLMPLVHLPKPVIAAVNGAAVGAGMNLALAADITIAADTARFSQAFVKVGLIPDTGGLYLLSRLVGMSRAKEICFTGRMLGAQEALAVGIVNRVVPPADLGPAAAALAHELAGGATAAIALTKSLLNRAPSATLEEMSQLEELAVSVALSTADHKEGVRAFIEKRPPRFRGE